MDLWLIFLTGLSVGGLTCLAVQGGLLASVIATREAEDISSSKYSDTHLLATISFLIAKLLIYTLAGALLGFFGDLLFISDQVRIILQVLAGVYMVVIALNLLNVHPIFRYAIIQPPKFLTRKIRNQSKSKDIYAPFILGLMTVFIPCGTTLAMETLALSSGSALQGALIMFVFTLATFPLFLGVGYLTAKLGEVLKRGFFKFAAFIILYLGVMSINGGLVAAGSPITLQKIAEASPIVIDIGDEKIVTSAKLIDGVQVFDIEVTASGYKPDYLEVKRGVPVKLNLKTNNIYNCATSFRIPELGIAKNLKATGLDSVEFIPESSGKMTFACSMGMYTGEIIVI